MKCYHCYLFVLLLAPVIDQGLCDEAAAESHSREKRQGPRGQRGPPHRPGEGPHHGHPEGHRGPEVEGDMYQPYSGGGQNNRVHETPRVESRFAETQSPNLLGLSLNLGGAVRPAQNVPMSGLGGMGGMGMGGFTRMPMLGGLGTNAGYTSVPNTGYTSVPNTGHTSAPNMGYTSTPTGGLLGLNLGNMPLLTVGGGQNPGLINIGGSQQSAGVDNRPNRGPQAPDHHNPPGHPGDRQPPGHQGRPGNGQQGHQGNDNRPGQPPGRPVGPQNERPDGDESFVDERPSYNEYTGQTGQQGQGGSAGRPSQNSGQSGNQGSNAQQLAWQNQGGGQGGSKKCRGNQYTCQNRECVPRNARCNGVNDCRDGSDELNCATSANGSGGQGTSTDRFTTAAPVNGVTTASPTGGCTLPEKPTGGSYELGSCDQPCNLGPGARVPLSSYLTYRCETGYTLKGNNVSFCHGGTWYLPPTCAKTCPPLKSNSVDIVCKLNGEIVSCESAIAPGTKATLACKHSYKIPLADDPAYREINCLDEGIWDRTLFRCLPECGTAVAHGNTLIVNGFTAKTGVFPWHVGIYQRNSGGNFDQICAGTLISPDLVISAAHCFYDDTINAVQDVSQYAVGAGKHYRLYSMPEKYAQKSLVKKIDVASRYYGASGNFAEDISLVRLQTPFTLTTLVRPICMDWDNTHEREQLQSGQYGKAVGWGKTAEGVPSTELQEINLPFVPYQECVSAVPEEFKAYVTADKFCAGYLNGSSLCEGDSGGGLCFQLNGLWYLRGIVSVSPISENTCDNNYYTAFTNVGRFREWIRAAYVDMV